MLDFRWKTFLTVISEGSLASAGKKLGLTQPAVSQHIKALEEHYGQALFDHKGRRLVLNDAGKLVQSTTEKSLRDEKKLEIKLKEYFYGRIHFRLGATLTVGEFILPAFLGNYHQSFPQRELTIQINNTVTILDQLKKGEIDLAVIEGPFETESIQHRLFMMDEMIFIGTDSYFPESLNSVDLQTLENSRLILREEGSGTRYHWEKYRTEKNLKLPDKSIIMEVGSLSAIKSLVEAGFGCSVMSRRAVEKELLLGTIKTKPLSWGALNRELNFVFSSNSPKAFVEEFIEYCST